MDGSTAGIIAGCASTFAVNLAVVIYGFGRITQKVDDICKEQNGFARETRDSARKAEERAKEGADLARDTSNDISYLKGRVDALIEQGKK